MEKHMEMRWEVRHIHTYFYIYIYMYTYIYIYAYRVYVGKAGVLFRNTSA